MRMDQIESLDSIESITDGASSRRNQLLVDLGAELNLGQAMSLGMKALKFSADVSMDEIKKEELVKNPKAKEVPGWVMAANLIFSPAKRVDVGLEYIYGTRQNKDGQVGHANQIQLVALIPF